MISDDDLRERMDRDIREDRDHWRDWRKRARECYAFVAGDQWDEQDRQTLRDQMRPVISFNRVQPVIDAVAGAEVSNRQEVRYIPREVGDTQVNEVLTGAAQWIRDECDAEDEESDAFVDLVICGLGWTNTRLDDSSADARVLIERVDPLEMLPDCKATKRNMDDARRVTRIRTIGQDEFEAMWPDKLGDVAVNTDSEFSEDDDDTSPQSIIPGERYQGDGVSGRNSKSGRYRVVEYQWCERVKSHVLLNPMTGTEETISDGQYRALVKKRPEFESLPHREVNLKRWYRAFKCGHTILEKSESPYPDGATYKAITGKRDRNNGAWYGLVEAMKDPQRWANKWLSQVLHIINSNAKGGLLAEMDAFANPRKAEEQWSDPTAITWLKSGALAAGKIQQKQIASYPTGLDRLMEFAISSIRDVTGVSVELMGLADRQQAGVLEYQRRQSGLTMLATLFDSLRRYRKEQGRLLLHYIQEYIPEGQIVRVTGPDGARYVPLTKQQGTARYDVIVDQTPTSPNQKEMTWQLLTQLLPSIKELMTPQLWLEVVKYSPLPSSFVERVQNIANEAAAQPQQPPPEVQAEMAKLDLKKQEMALGAQNDAAKMDMMRQEAAVQAQIDAWRAQQDIQIQREKAAADIETKRMVHAAEMDMQRENSARDAMNNRALGEKEIEMARAPQILIQNEAKDQMETILGRVGEMQDTLAQSINDMRQVSQNIVGIGQTMIAGIKEMQKDREIEIIRDPKTGRAKGGRSRVVN